MTAAEIGDLIRRSCLTDADKIIGYDALAKRMYYEDVAAEVEDRTRKSRRHGRVHRTTVARRLARVIVPELERIMAHDRSGA